MYARVTHYRMKPESVESGTALLHDLKDRIMGLPGMIHFINSVNSDGSGCVVSVVESKEISDANAEEVQAIWAAFAHHLASAPEMNGYDVIANWSN